MAAPVFKEFMNDDEAVKAVNELKTQVDEDNIYILTHDDDHTKRVANRADANKVGASETGITTSVKNVFRKKGDELRAKFEELGFSETESNNLESELDKGAVIVVVKDAPAGITL
ncbi:general stress protein [Geomicrobium sediminis]|uniref:Phenylalanyl-tRNA synthetase alpha subunit n=1 Tax=Geomicrobium sediminis TaxID=1347788 RepID=A0ABS2PIC6_9BACL|nr:general stress protein [Geomicrobium sediminis]MBM7635182.1 phenylalanyl-tRNA synthetase alpha subunit [Geomicrobium sediminis]